MRDLLWRREERLGLQLDDLEIVGRQGPPDYPAYRRQLGLYGFAAEGLETFRNLDQGPLECAEDVESLRFIEHSHYVRMLPVVDSGVAVDTPEDLVRACFLLEQEQPRSVL
ncbi:glycosyltransferase family protein [Streptomyces halobius]|uniref:3-deoxy-manno-octulosonate cytidylyltransferase n=1 Tax=Streptomyces halobius TaxID=2879846 RepID=A0ABY4MFY4_9ACTN|nr:hypothetical protein [Streptomyces halobius]UQA96623.1 hypothetical protein K9S39_36330 [Streptomyces halobius]